MANGFTAHALMTGRNWHKIWIEQCKAAEGIKLRYGLKAAFDDAVGEKLRTFAEAAAQHPDGAVSPRDGAADFLILPVMTARELPRFVSRVRQTFTAQERAVALYAPTSISIPTALAISV